MPKISYQENVETAQKCIHQECRDVLDTSGCPRHRSGPTSLANIKDPVVLLERNLNGHPLAGLLWERQFEKKVLSFRTRMGNSAELGMFICSSKIMIILIGIFG